MDAKNHIAQKLVFGLQIDEGSAAVVFEATRPKEKVAVKLFREDYPEDVQSELKIHQSLKHPRIIALLGELFEKITVDDAEYHGGFILELAQMSLQYYLDEFKNNKRTQDKCLQYAKDLAEGVNYLHSRYIFHADIKPDNALIMHDGRLKISDFGLAEQVSEERPYVVDQKPRGTVLYMAAELHESVEGGHQYGLPADIYALMWILYLLTTDSDTEPYEGVENLKDVKLKHINHELPIVPKTASTSLQTLIYSGLHKNPQERPTATQVHEFMQKTGIVFRPAVKR